MYPILPPDLTQPIPFTEVYVDTIKEKKLISETIINLNKFLPVPKLSHLKRIKGLEVILFPVNNNKKIEEVHKHLEEVGFNTSTLKNEIKIVQVAKLPPRIRKQYETVHKLWPCNFHPDKYLEKLATNTLFSQSELNQHKEYMKIAINAGKYANDNFKASSKHGAVVVDPKTESVVAVGYSQTHDNPIKHPVMVAIDNVSTTQDGGAWLKQENLYSLLEICKKFKLESGEAIDSQQLTSDVLNMPGIPEEMLDYLKNIHPTIKFGSTKYKSKEDGPYLCTNYWVYTTREPCAMCSMALIHSRIKFVFYGIKNIRGCLGSTCKIHCVEDLNHHFEVFAGLLETECLEIEVL